MEIDELGKRKRASEVIEHEIELFLKDSFYDAKAYTIDEIISGLDDTLDSKQASSNFEILSATYEALKRLEKRGRVKAKAVEGGHEFITKYGARVRWPTVFYYCNMKARGKGAK